MTKRPDQSRDDDADDFVHAMADVARIKADPRGRVRAVPNATAPHVAAPSAKSATPRDHDDDLVGGFVAAGVDRRELRKLRRGDHVPGDRLDLHGLTGAEAVASVTRFIDGSRLRHRSVSIVHGRGLHSEGNVAILKTRVRECLRQHRAVLAYADAPRSDGGAGAVYVLLRKG